MNWKKIIKKNSVDEKYHLDCQLVSAINIYYYLTNKVIKQGSDEYKNLAHLAGCCWGKCVFMERVYEKIGIEVEKKFAQPITNFDKMIPCEARINHKCRGRHSVAILDSDNENNKIRVSNFFEETDSNGWINVDRFNSFLDKNSVYYYNKFKLKNEKQGSK